MMIVPILILNCIWLSGMSYVYRKNDHLMGSNLGVEIILATAAVSGVNFLFGIMLLFNLMESAPNDLLDHIIGQKAILARLILFIIFFVVNFIFVARQVRERLERSFESP